jgi:DNA-binding response OmpR family regulator
MKGTILIIDDDAKLNDLLIEFLGYFGLKAIAVTRPEEGLKRLRSESPDLIILDVMLPGMNGFEVCKAIRRGMVSDKIVGLELGADDYLPKPFEPRELVARIQSVLRRSQGLDPAQVKRFGRLEIDFPKRVAKVDGAVVDLTTNEFAALALLVRNRGKVLNRDQILGELSGIESEAFNRTVDITMSRLRHKLGDDPKTPAFIKTVRGTGYVFVGDEDRDADEPSR